MILRRFLTLTAETPALELRRAVARALEDEIPHTPETYDQFYRRVLAELHPARPSRSLAKHVA